MYGMEAEIQLPPKNFPSLFPNSWLVDARKMPVTKNLLLNAPKCMYRQLTARWWMLHMLDGWLS